MQQTMRAEEDAAEQNRILIVEDEGIVALNLEQMLTRLGYEVVGLAQSGSEALRLIEARRPDAVLMDINLGSGSDGIDTAAKISGDLRPAVVYLTAYSERRTLARAAETRPYGYLLKPFSDRDVHATLQMALGRRKTDLALAESSERLQLALDSARMGTWDYEPASGRMHVASTTRTILGVSEDDGFDTFERLLDRTHVEDRARMARAIETAASHETELAVDFRTGGPTAASHWVRLLARWHERAGGKVRLIGLAQDITVARDAEKALRQASVVFESSREAIFIADANLALIAVNASFAAMTGHAAGEVRSRRIDTWLFREAADRPILDIDAAFARDGLWQGELCGIRSDGSTFPAWLSLTRVPDGGGAEARVVGIFSDIGALRRAEEELVHQALHDDLTGLPNRRLAMQRLDEALGRSARRHRRTAVLLVDLDRFNDVNDALGHQAGDACLKATASRLRQGVRPDDTVARLGNDEFVVIVEDIEGVDGVAALAGQLIDAVMQPLTIAGRETRLGTSIGVSVFPDDGSDATSLIRAADLALHRAKTDGRHRSVFYEPQMSNHVMERLVACQDLRRALAEDEIVVHYQPQVAIHDLRIVGLEALVRWRHSARGLLGACEVVPLAESCSLIVDVGRVVMQSTCRQIRRWLDDGLRVPRVAINVSVQQLRLQGFVDDVADALAEYGLTADRIELELTESALQEERICKPAMDALAALGVSLAIDDFGTGYSSLASLRTLPVTRCKIDRSFIEEIDTRASDALIAGAVIDLGHRLRLQITAEGVETPAQLEVLRELGCDDIQGFLIARPMGADALARLLERGAEAFAEPLAS